MRRAFSVGGAVLVLWCLYLAMFCLALAIQRLHPPLFLRGPW